MRVNFGGGSYELTTKFGAVDSWHRTGHSGLDLAMPSGTPLKSPVEGVIEKVFDYGNQNAGKGVIIDTGNGDHLIFGHMSETGGMHVGQHISPGQVVGLSGSTGRSSGPHLHLGVKNDMGKFVDPSKYLDGGTATQHIASVPPPTPKPSFTSDNIVDMFGSQMHSFFDQMASWSIQFIHWTFNLPVLDLIHWLF